MVIEEEGGGGDDDDDFMEQIRGRTLSELDRSLLKGHEFDVFLSFAPADLEFAIEMRLRLVHRWAAVFNNIIISFLEESILYLQ